MEATRTQRQRLESPGATRKRTQLGDYPSYYEINWFIRTWEKRKLDMLISGFIGRWLENKPVI